MIDPKLREDGPEITPRLLRQFAGLSIVVFGGLSLIEVFLRHRSERAAVFAFLAIGIGAPGLIWPTVIRPVFRGAAAITTPIGWVVTRVVLAAIFYLVFTPIAFVFRLTGRDALLRKPGKDARTYWRRVQPASELRSYLHQS